MPKRKPQTPKQRLDNLLKGARAVYKQAREEFTSFETTLDGLVLAEFKGWDNSFWESFNRGHKLTLLGRRRTNEANRLAKEVYSVVPAEYSKAIQSLYDTYHRVGYEQNNRVVARANSFLREAQRASARKRKEIQDRERFAKLAREKAEARQLRKSTPPTSQMSNWWETPESE